MESLGRAGGSRLFGKQEPIKLGLFRLQNFPLNMVNVAQRQSTRLQNEVSGFRNSLPVLNDCIWLRGLRRLPLKGSVPITGTTGSNPVVRLFKWRVALMGVSRLEICAYLRVEGSIPLFSAKKR